VACISTGGVGRFAAAEVRFPACRPVLAEYLLSICTGQAVLAWAVGRAHRGSVMMKRWADLTPRSRRFVVVAAVVEAVLKVAALVDLARRPAAEVNGSKVRWALVITLVNSLGAAPLAYFAYGRRKRR